MSSTLSTDRRWAPAPARKSGMTVLGKVPKPINLPSVRSENNGLDPNLEIVPKGTLTWGSKAPSATPNAWGSSSVISIKNDGSSSSSNHFNGRASSGGGSRPSTAGSESLGSPNAWGPNSRPSSASGTFPSSHLPMATNRPRSAETTPGSSQLSRFADNAPDNMRASIRTIDRSGSSSHGHGFTLSTGDFPTLGSEVNSQRGHSSKGRPTSSSGKEAPQAEQVKSLTAGTGEVISPSNNHADIMKTEQHAHTGGARAPTTGLPNEGLQPQPYPQNFHMPPQFDSWRAPPGQPPEGMWHRGAAPGGPYRHVGPPGSFPVDPYGYYGQFPPNSEAAARQGSGHGGYHPQNGDVYHPMPPNSYIMNQPVIPVRPVYQGPVPYDGYYGPQANFNNANVGDPNFVGGPRQPGVLSHFPNQNDKFHPEHSQSRQGKHEPVLREQLEPDKVHMFRRGPGSLRDNPDRLGVSHEFERNVQPAPPLLPHPDENRTDMNMRTDTRDTYSERNSVLSKSLPNQRGPVGTDHSSVFEDAHYHPRETGDDTLRKKFKDDSSVTLDQQPVIKKNTTLIEKIESLNNKSRNVDARNVPEPASSKEFKKQQKSTDISSTAVITGACASDQGTSVSHIPAVVQRLPNVPSEGTVVGAAHSHLTECSKAGKLGDSINDRAHRRGDSLRNSHHGPSKDRQANKLASHGRVESSTADSLPVTDLRNNIQHGQRAESASQLQPVIVSDDMPASLDYESQRAKMKELAAERAKKLKAEEEERIKNQKAKALVKLEELNMRSSVVQKKSNDTKVETDDAHDKQKAGLATSTAEPCDVTAHDNLTVLSPPDDPKHTLVHVQPQTTTLSHAPDGGKEPAAHATSSSVRTTQSNMNHVGQKSISQSHGTSVPKPKQGYRKRHVVSEEKISGEKPIVSISTGNAKKNSEVPVDTATVVVAPHDDPPVQNKKGGRHLRNKKKVDDAPLTSKHPPMVFNEQNKVKVPSEPKTHTGGVIISSSILPTEDTIVTVGSITVGGMSLASLNQDHVKSPDGPHNTESSQPRPQQEKRSGKHQHAVRAVEKPHGNEGVLWAPIKPPVQNEQSDGTMRNATVANPTAGKTSNDGENVTRTKRAEMERYVPKPMSKELQQQNLGHDKEAIDNSSAAKLDAAAEPKKLEDKKTSKGHGKSNPSWRRRNTDESSLAPNSIEQADNSHESKEVQKSSNQNQPVEPGKQEDKQLKSKADAAAESNTARVQTVPLSINAAKEHSAANRQRRQHVKGQRNEASSYSNESKYMEGRIDFVYQSTTPAMDSNSSEQRSMPRSDVKSSGAVSHSKTHWKPKSNSHPQNSSDGSSAVEGQVDTHGGRVEVNSSKGSDSSTCQDSRCSKPTKRNDGIDEKFAHSEQENLTRVDGNEKGETEQELVNPPPRRQGQNNTRYHRGRGGYDAGRPSHGANVERRRGGSHLEYQPVGSHNKTTDLQQNLSVEERTEGPPATGPAFRERGHNRGSRPAGHFVRRNPVPAPAANSYQDE